MLQTQAQVKDLLCFAHHGEAQAFLSHFDFKPMKFFFDGLFESDSYFLLLTQEGEQNTTERVTSVISYLHPHIHRVYNIGIAGSLNLKLRIGEIHKIRTSYAFQDSEPKFRSFTLAEEKLPNCISSDRRVINKELAEKLSCFADVVDRELWAVASSCQLLKKPLSSIKLISDSPLIQNSFEICEPVRENAQVFSAQLLQYFLSEQKSKPEEIQPAENPIFQDVSFHFTASMKHQYLELISRLESEPQLDEYRKLKVPAKIRTQKLLNEMRGQLNPLQKKIQEQTEDMKTQMNKKQIQIKFSEHFETDEVQFHFSAKDQNELETKIKSLSQFSFENIHNILTGKDL